MRNLVLILTLAAVLGFAAPARADCMHNGQTVAEGTRIGGFVCRGGQWVDG
jgi:hypothetical protein